MAYLVDTNLLLRSAQPTHPMYSIATNALTTLRLQGQTLHVVPQNLIELWAVCTRPVVNNGLGMTAARASAELSRVKSFFLPLPDTPAIYPEWERLVILHAVLGRQVHDARLVAAMNIHGISQLLTFNTGDFARYTSITAVHP